MKKFLSLLVLVLMLGLVLVGCAPSEKYADKINKAAEEEKYMTYSQVEKYLGEPAISVGGDVAGLIKTPKICTWYKGYKSTEEANEAYDNGKEVCTLVVTFDTSDNATKAVWSVSQKEAEK